MHIEEGCEVVNVNNEKRIFWNDGRTAESYFYFSIYFSVINFHCKINKDKKPVLSSLILKGEAHCLLLAPVPGVNPGLVGAADFPF